MMTKKKWLSLAIAGAIFSGSTGIVFAAPEEAAGESPAVEEKAAAVADTSAPPQNTEADSSKENLAVFSMDQIVVTATRTEKRDIDVPASNEVITAEDIKRSGASDLHEALGKVNGMVLKAYGPLGSSMGTMANEINVRGYDGGTLILVNGSPIAWRGKYNLGEIPADMIERIEVVKGGGSVLYGSEAMGGVINVITKKKAANEVTVGFGNMGRQKYNINAGVDGLTVYYNRDYWRNNPRPVGNFYSTLDTWTDIRKIKNENYGINYSPNKKFDISVAKYKTSSRYNRFVDALHEKTKAPIKIGDPFNYRDYSTERNNAQINFHDKGWKVNAYYNLATTESKGRTYYTSGGDYEKENKRFYNTRERSIYFGTDVQKEWKVGEKSTYVAGVNWKKDMYRDLHCYTNDATPDKMIDVHRDTLAVFFNWDHKMDDKNTIILGGRETWTTGGTADRYKNFSWSAQYLHKLTDDHSLYLSANKSFIMPTFGQIYGQGNGLPSPGLRPQTGMNYEMGWKHQAGKHYWKAALFKMVVKDNITANYVKNDIDTSLSEWQYINEDFRNVGFELSHDFKRDKGLSWNYGFTWQNPKSKSSGEGAKKPYWDRKFGKFQLVGGLGYNLGKFRSDLTFTYLADRVGVAASTKSFRLQPYLLTSLTFGYEPTKHCEINLAIDNILNRKDKVTHSTSNYECPGTNFMLSFTQKF